MNLGNDIKDETPHSEKSNSPTTLLSKLDISISHLSGFIVLSFFEEGNFTCRLRS